MENSKPKHLSPWIAWSVVILAFGIGLFCVWYYYFQAGTAYDNSVTNFVGIKNKSAGTTSTTTASKGVLRVTQLGIQFTLQAELSGIYYVVKNGYAYFGTKNLDTLGGSTCTADADGPLGVISVSTTPLTQNEENGTLIKQVGDKYLYYGHVQDVCSTNAGFADAEQSAITAFQQALQTATAIQ